MSNLPLFELIWPLAVSLALILLLVAVRVTRKGPRPVRIGLYILCLLGICEFAVFRNPVCLAFFRKHCNSEQLGWKQRDSLRLELISKEKSWNKKYIAFGSSQTNVVFREYADSHQDFEVINCAGMSPVEIWWYRDLVKQHCDDTVILYLSEFDLTRELDPSSYLISPQTSASNLSQLSNLLREKEVANISDLAELWIANHYATFRYHFIADGLIRRVAEKIVDSSGLGAPLDEKVSDNPTDRFVKAMKTSGDEWFETNLTALDQFLYWAAANELNVVVAQGHYHPDAIQKLQSMRLQATESLTALCQKHAHARYVPVESLATPSATGYVDQVHTSGPAGEILAESLLRHLEQTEQTEQTDSL